MMNDRPERSLDWNDTIENDSSFVLLPAGDYDFTVTKFERARHQPGPNSKLPPCNKAVLTLEVTDGQQRTSVTHNLFLHSRCEGMLCEFFTAIGQRKHGEPLRMDWSKVLGAHGRCKVGVRDWIGRDGQTMQSNEIKRFYEPSAPAAQSAAAPAAEPVLRIALPPHLVIHGEKARGDELGQADVSHLTLFAARPGYRQ